MSNGPSHQFVGSSQFEPEGIFLTPPLEGAPRILQGWGEHPSFHSRFTYNGVPIKGHLGLDLAAAEGAWVLAADAGRVIEISVEPGGFGQYIKLDHVWGESLYAHIVAPAVDSGQAVSRGQRLARVEPARRPYAAHLHFAVRILPYNRFDGWGGFSDPLPYLYLPEPVASNEVNDPDDQSDSEANVPSMISERPGMRRP